MAVPRFRFKLILCALGGTVILPLVPLRASGPGEGCTLLRPLKGLVANDNAMGLAEFSKLNPTARVSELLAQFQDGDVISFVTSKNENGFGVIFRGFKVNEKGEARLFVEVPEEYFFDVPVTEIRMLNYGNYKRARGLVALHPGSTLYFPEGGKLAYGKVADISRHGEIKLENPDMERIVRPENLPFSDAIVYPADVSAAVPTEVLHAVAKVFFDADESFMKQYLAVGGVRGDRARFEEVNALNERRFRDDLDSIRRNARLKSFGKAAHDRYAVDYLFDTFVPELREYRMRKFRFQN